MSDYLANVIAQMGGMNLGAFNKFFEPNESFYNWAKAEFPNCIWVDCGAGRGHVTKGFMERPGMIGIAIDLFPSDLAEVPVQQFAAQRFPFVEGMTPLICRPCRGDWIRDTIDRAIEMVGVIVYVGLEKHYREDILSLPYFVEQVLDDAGEEGESVWVISKERRNKMSTIEKSYDKLVAITTVDRSIRTAPTFVALSDISSPRIKINWGAGFSWCCLPADQFEIIAEFPYEDDNDIHAAEVLFAKMFAPKAQEPCARMGWIAPNGDFYPCGYVCHDDLASTLCLVFELSGWGGPTHSLEKAGWGKLGSSGLFSVDSATESQTKTLEEILAEFRRVKSENPEVNWNHVLMQNPEGYAEQNWFSLPDEDDNYIERLQDCLDLLTGEYARRIREHGPILAPEAGVLSKRVGELNSGD